MRFPRSKKAIYINAFLYLCYSWLLLKTTSFKNLAARLGEPMTESSMQVDNKAMETALKFGKSIKKISNYTPFRSMCFEQALTLKFMLNRKKIPCTVYFGVAESDTPNFKAHSWTRVGDYYVTGKKGKEEYTVISTFS